MTQKTRKTPVQARARRTRAKILTTTARLLDEVGFAGLNTNLIAERAEVNISAVYKYFPDKYSIITELAEQLNDTQTELILSFLYENGDELNWQELLAGSVDVMIQGSESLSGVASLQSAMHATPELKNAYRKANVKIITLMLDIFEQKGFSFPSDKKHLICLCLGEIITALLDLSVSGGRRFEPTVINEAKRAAIAYIHAFNGPEIP